MLVLWPKEFSIKEKISLGEISKKLTLDVLETVLQALNNKKIQKHDVQAILLDIVKGKPVNEAVKLEKQSNEELEKLENEIIKVIKEKPGLSINAYMGLIMAKFKGKIHCIFGNINISNYLSSPILMG